MGQKLKPVIEYHGKPLYSTINKKCYRVAFDKKQGKGAYRLYCNNEKICSRNTLDEIAAEYYLCIQIEDAVAIKPYELLHKSVDEINIMWIDIHRSDKSIQEYLLEFYGEQYYVEPEDGEEAPTLERIFNGGDTDCQAAIRWDSILAVRKIIKNNPDYEPVLHHPWMGGMMFNAQGRECYIVFHKKENKSTIIQEVCKSLTMSTNCFNKLSKNELKHKLLKDVGITTVSKYKNSEKDSPGKVIRERDLEKYYNQYIYEANGKKINLVQAHVTKEYIIREFMKLLKENKEEVAALAGIPKLLELELP